MSESSYEYFSRRAREERGMEEACVDSVMASAHRRMAEHYEECIAALNQSPDRSGA